MGLPGSIPCDPPEPAPPHRRHARDPPRPRPRTKHDLIPRGGGSWFQEGVAEYVETSHRERKAFARKAARKGEYVPFREFVQIPSLVGRRSDERVDGGSQASDNYKQAASIIEFLRDSKWAPDKFEDFLQAVGNVSRGDLEAIEAALQKVYGAAMGASASWCSGSIGARIGSPR